MIIIFNNFFECLIASSLQLIYQESHRIYKNQVSRFDY